MFTIRFVRPDRDYKAYSVVSYDVKRGSEHAEVEMSRKLNGQDSFTEYVGADERYEIAYITNLDGKTIDVVRGFVPDLEKLNADKES